MTRLHRSLAPLLAVTAASTLQTGCGEPIGLSFGALQGGYSFAQDGWACSGTIRGSALDATCAIRTDQGSDEWSEWETVGTATLTGTLASDRLDAVVRLATEEVYREEYDDGAYCALTRRTIDISIGATKTSDRAVSGPLAALAGGWDVDVAFASELWYGSEETSRGDACEAARADLEREDGSLVTYDVALDIVGSMATGTYRSDEGRGSFSFNASDDALDISGVRIVRD